MTGVSGLSTLLGLKIADTTRDARVATIQSSAEHSRAIAGFSDRIAGIRSVEALLEDRELYVFVMKAFDLEDRIFGKAMIRKVLESDPAKPDSLVRKLTDPRFMELHKTLGFGPDGVGNSSVSDKSWQQDIINRYVERQFINGQTNQNENVGNILEFRQKAPKIKNWFDVLKDPVMAQFMRTAVGLPAESVRLDVDRQAALFAKKFDLEKLQNPEERAKLERMYAIITDARDTSRISQNAAVQLMSGAVSAGAGGGQFVPTTLDITIIGSIPRRPYR
ncbi:MAG: DUF1217 domain-containing protein [Rhodobacterales bacterium]